MSTFPYVDISHKKIWRPLSTGRYVDPSLFLFIYFVAVSLPSWPNCGAFVQTGQVPRGLHRDVAPSPRVWAGGGLRVCAPLPPPLSPLLVTIRRNVVAGSMTPWAEAASPLVAPGGCRRRARARAAAQATCRGQGRSAALSPRPAQVPGARAGRGVRDPGPGGRPCLPKPTFAPGTAAGAFRPPHERLIFVGVAASLWLPQDLVSSPLQTCPFPSRFAGRRLRRLR